MIEKYGDLPMACYDFTYETENVLVGGVRIETARSRDWSSATAADEAPTIFIEPSKPW